MGAPAAASAGQQGIVQRHGAGGAFTVEAGPLGLVSSGGKPLPEAVRGKMEAALGADFSNVRVHVGPQAARIGAIAFTVGSDIYFAPGRYQPETIQGQQLLGHELAHVVQQRARRVRNPLRAGLAVVQDRALEAEADRLGQRAAAHPVAMQAKLAPRAAQSSAPVRISPPMSAGSGSYRLSAGASGREIGSVMVHARERGAVEVTDLGVNDAQRGNGVGRMLVAAAARTGLRSGRSKVTLAAQDRGSGHLTRWYKEMGFTQTGVNRHGYPQMEAPISRLLAGTAQRKEQPAEPYIRPPHPTHNGPAQRKPGPPMPSMRRVWRGHVMQRMDAKRTNFSTDTRNAVPIQHGEHRRHIIPNSLMKDAINSWFNHHKVTQLGGHSRHVWLDTLNNYIPNLHPGGGIANMAAGGIMHQGHMVEDKISSLTDVSDISSMTLSEYPKVSAFGGTGYARGLVSDVAPTVSSFSSADDAKEFVRDMGHSGGFDWPEGANPHLYAIWFRVYNLFVQMRDHPDSMSEQAAWEVFQLFLGLPDPKR